MCSSRAKSFIAKSFIAKTTSGHLSRATFTVKPRGADRLKYSDIKPGHLPGIIYCKDQMWKSCFEGSSQQKAEIICSLDPELEIAFNSKSDIYMLDGSKDHDFVKKETIK